MNYDIFKDNKEKQEARDSLPTLEKHPAWKFITRTLDVNIAYLTDELRKKEFTDLSEVQLKQKQIIHLEELKHLPDTIVQSAQPDIEEEDDSIY